MGCKASKTPEPEKAPSARTAVIEAVEEPVVEEVPVEEPVSKPLPPALLDVEGVEEVEEESEAEADDSPRDTTRYRHASINEVSGYNISGLSPSARSSMRKPQLGSMRVLRTPKAAASAQALQPAGC